MRWEELITSRRVALFHFFLASAFFAPFLFQGHVLLGSTDLLNLNYPLLLEAKRNFWRGDWGWWNPYLLAGTPSASLAVAPLFRPENWILFLAPERWLFRLLTLFEFLKLGLLGIVAFHLFEREVRSRRWALLGASAYQLCGYTVWAITTSSLSLLLFFTAALYVIWSFDKRTAGRNYLLLTLCLVGILTSSNLAYDLYGVLGVALLGAAHLRCARRAPGLLTLGLGLLTAALLSSLRWLPSLVEWAGSTRASPLLEAGADGKGWLALRLFLPELFGVSYWTSSQILQSLSPELRHTTVHVHSHFPQFFGAASLLVILWALCLRGKSKAHVGWLIYVAIVLASLLGLELTNPLFHRAALQLWLPIGACALLAHSAAALENAKYPSRRLSKPAPATWIVPIVPVALALLWALPERLDGYLRAEALVLTAGIVALVAVFPWRENHRRDLGGAIALACLLSLWIPWSRDAFTLPGASQVLFFLGLGGLRFCLVMGALCLLISRLHRGAWPVQVLFPLLMAISLCEWLPAFKNYGDMVLNPFSPSASPFRSTEAANEDWNQYRVNLPNLASGIESYRALFGDRETLSSLHLVAGIRSYGGYVSAVPSRYARWLDALAPGADFYGGRKIRNGFAADLKQERALDLLGVGFDLGVRRPNALSRFQRFRSFEVIEDESKVLKRISDPAFDPRRTLVVSSHPAFPPSNFQSEPLLPNEGKGIELTVENFGPALVLFNDSFHGGWKADIDGEPAPILLANGNFMAVAVPGGKKFLRFRFEPPSVVTSRWITLAGLLVFAAVLLGLKAPEPSSAHGEPAWVPAEA